MKFCHLILIKITKFVATRCQILRLKCTKFDFAGGAYSAPPHLLAGFKGPTSMGGKGERRGRGSEKGERKGRGKERGGKEREGTLNVSPTLKSWLRHWPLLCVFHRIR